MAEIISVNRLMSADFIRKARYREVVEPVLFKADTETGQILLKRVA